MKIEWTNGRKTLNPVNPAEFYPGDKAVDIIGVHYYDNPELGRMTTQGDLGQALGRSPTPRRSPGSRTLARARQEQGQAALDFGMGGLGSGGIPSYIEKMFQFFKTNADSLAYESYFNCADHHSSTRSTSFPPQARSTGSSGPRAEAASRSPASRGTGLLIGRPSGLTPPDGRATAALATEGADWISS